MKQNDLYLKHELLLPPKFDGEYLIIALYEKIKSREIEEAITQNEINEIPGKLKVGSFNFIQFSY